MYNVNNKILWMDRPLPSLRTPLYVPFAFSDEIHSIPLKSWNKFRTSQAAFSGK